MAVDPAPAAPRGDTVSFPLLPWGMLATLLLCCLVPLSLTAEVPDARIEAVALSFFPDADRLGPFEGEPPAAKLYGADRLLGYVLLSDQVLSIPAYSGQPISMLVGFDLQGVIGGVEILEHQEPILLAGVSERQLRDFIAQYPGKSIDRRIRVGAGANPTDIAVDGISGATITVMVINASINRATRQVAQSRGLLSPDGRLLAIAEDAPPAPGQAMWQQVWRQRTGFIAVLGAGIGLLLLVLIFQDALARHPSLLIWVRDAYLLYTLVFIGWYGLAQLSVVNVLTFINAVLRGFRWDSFLIDPGMFILWSFVAATLLLWGRAVYCGWLCPFGALQELLFQLGRRLGLKGPYELPRVVHERLLALKYLIFLGLFGLSLQSIGTAELWSEVEPFKTAITLRFQRDWPYVVYAVGLLALALVNRKLYCKYLCPLGAALAIPTHLRLFDWLRRRKECGRPCQICANECEVQAIRATGEIDAGECHYCLDCQVTYCNAHRCPPLVERRKRKERSGRARELAAGMEQSMRRPARAQDAESDED